MTDQPKLTELQRRVLSLLSFGLPQRQVADQLRITPGAVGMHGYRARKKLGAHTTAHAIGICYRLRLFRPPPLEPQDSEQQEHELSRKDTDE